MRFTEQVGVHAAPAGAVVRGRDLIRVNLEIAVTKFLEDGAGPQLGSDPSEWGSSIHSLVPVTRTNGQPSWIATLGLQFVTSRKRGHSID